MAMPVFDDAVSLGIVERMGAKATDYDQSPTAAVPALPSVTIRDFFPETWLWDLVVTE